MSPVISFILSALFWIIHSAFWFLVCTLFALWWAQGYLIYLPTIGGRAGFRRKLSFNPHSSRSPAELNLYYREYFIKTIDDVLIHTWFIPAVQSPSSIPSSSSSMCTSSSTLNNTSSSSPPTIIFFHGNAGNIGNRLFNAHQMITLLGCHVLLVEYRGYGNSSGSPSQQGLCLDALAALDLVRSLPNVDINKIFIFGRSLGGAVAVWLSYTRPGQIAGLIIENTFTSIIDMALVLLGQFITMGPRLTSILRLILPTLITSPWDTAQIITKINIPTLLLAGQEDELVPHSQMLELYSLLSSTIYNKSLYIVPTGSHNDTYVCGGLPYYQRIKTWMNTILQQQYKHKKHQQQQLLLMNNNITTEQTQNSSSA